MLNKAIGEVEDENEALHGVLKGNIDFNAQVAGKPKIKNQDLKDLLDHFNRSVDKQGIPLVNSAFQFPDLLGAAYEYLIKYFADSAGKKGGQFYTPPWVVRLMVRLVQPQQRMSIYDPTVGSGGMLIQSSQYVTEQGGDGSDLDFYGQDNDPGVVSIAKMNLILHNLASAHIEFGDVLEDPQNVRDGQLMAFDRVLANPPFAQNWNLSRCQRTERFQYGHAPQTGKKADLMFLQHMLASLKPTGRGAVVMPHGVLFRGRKEKDIRRNLIKAGVIEAIIGLPPKLFYGTGIPAVIVVLNKSIADHDRDCIFIINADREFAEGKKQNSLRPEDIEKIEHIFRTREELKGYSRLVPIAEIERDHDWNLNLRRYVDNTPLPESEDVRCHLIGGVPRAEVTANQAQFAKFAVAPSCVFEELDELRLSFKDGINTAAEVRSCIENQPEIANTRACLSGALSKWWDTACHDFAELAPTNGHHDASLPRVRSTLLEQIVGALVQFGVLDRFQVRGVFVNWWEGIKYDLKTITSLGWAPTLIPESLVVARFFAAERDALAEHEKQIAEAELLVAEVVEEAQAVLEYDADEDETVSAPTMRALLADEIGEAENGDSEALKSVAEKLKRAEEVLRNVRGERDRLNEELQLKIELKLYGADDRLEGSKRLLNEAEEELAALGGAPPEKPPRRAKGQAKVTKEDKENFRKRKALAVDIRTLEARISYYALLLTQIDGVITTEDARELILQKHHDLVAGHLQRYVEVEERVLLGIVDNLFSKYAKSAQKLEAESDETVGELDDLLKRLGFK